MHIYNGACFVFIIIVFVLILIVYCQEKIVIYSLFLFSLDILDSLLILYYQSTLFLKFFHFVILLQKYCYYSLNYHWYSSKNAGTYEISRSWSCMSFTNRKCIYVWIIATDNQTSLFSGSITSILFTVIRLNHSDTN